MTNYYPGRRVRLIDHDTNEELYREATFETLTKGNPPIVFRVVRGKGVIELTIPNEDGEAVTATISHVNIPQLLTFFLDGPHSRLPDTDEEED